MSPFKIALIALAAIVMVAYAEDLSATKDLELSETKGRRYQYANYGHGYGHTNTYGTVLQTPTYHNNGYNTYKKAPNTGYVQQYQHRPVEYRPVVQYYGYQKPYVYQQKGYDSEEVKEYEKPKVDKAYKKGQDSEEVKEYQKPKAYKGSKKGQDSEEVKEYEKPKVYKAYQKGQESEEVKEYQKPKAHKGSKKGDDSEEEKDEPKGGEKSKSKGSKKTKSDDKKKEKKPQTYEVNNDKGEEYGKYNGYISHSG
uniref:Cuticular protein n=1 Tax=Daphnia galeata TaxID=27404 RepID=A0A8J2RNT9_9CRUS|nr:unnamed protein product [Daphnia galeata]